MSVDADVDADVEAINDVYERLEKDDIDIAIAASLNKPIGKVPVTNTPLGRASATSKNRLNPLKNRESKKPKKRIIDAMVAALDTGPFLLNNNRGAQGSINSELECSACTTQNNPGTNICEMCNTNRFAVENKAVKNINAVHKKQESLPPIIKKSRENKIKTMTSDEIKEKHTLESKLPPELNGANVEIIKREGDCFFISVTHQLRAYGFNVLHEYQTVRDLVAEYIEKSHHITLDMIKFESPNYTTRKQYTDALRENLWGGKLEIIVIHDGCLSSLTNGQSLRINVYSVNNSQIELHRGFKGTRPDDVRERFPIRLLYVGNNHFHRIYFNDINYQKLDYHDEVRPAELISGQHIDPDTGMTLDEKARQLEAYKHFQKDESVTPINDSPSQWSCSQCTYLNDDGTTNCAACEAALNKADLLINDECGMSKKEKEEQLKELEKYDNSDGYQDLKLSPISLQVDSKTAHEFGLTPSSAADQINRFQQFEKHGQKIVKIVEDVAYLSLQAKCLDDPFMIMGYQNGHTNLHYESTWEKEEENIFIGRIYIPKDDDPNNRKYTRYPHPFMSNTVGKTIVNLSLHNWAFGMYYWKKKSQSSEKEIDVNIKMSDTLGVSEVEKTEKKADFYSISKTQKLIKYTIHDFSYSPDTGVLALDGDTCRCKIEIENGPTLILIFYRNKDDYDRTSKIGGTRKRRRQTKRRKSKRRQTKRR